MVTKVLNLYAGIGGNRKLWGEVEDIDVTAVEWDEDKAQVYRDHFPNDTVEVTDAHEYLLEHIEEFDFIWASPPCPTHSCLEAVNHKKGNYRYPDMNLYQEIILLEQHNERLGFDYVIENVQSYYDPLVEPQQVSRHYFWANYTIGGFDAPNLAKTGTEVRESRGDTGKGFDMNEHENALGYDLSKFDITKTKKGKMLRNCVHPKLGKHVFASRGKQATLF